MTNCVYFVEGECEKKLLDSLKEANLIIPGKVKVFNVIQNDLSKSHLLTIKDGYVVFVFDTDVNVTTHLETNIKRVEQILKKGKLLFLPQVKNFEDEMVRSTAVRKLRDITNSKSDNDFKRDFLASKDALSLLKKHNFNISKMWNQKIPSPFSSYINKNGRGYIFV